MPIYEYTRSYTLVCNSTNVSLTLLDSTNVPLTPPGPPHPVDTPQLEVNPTTSLAVLVDGASLANMHPSGNGFIISTENAEISIQGHFHPTHNAETGEPNSTAVMHCEPFSPHSGQMPENNEIVQYPPQPAAQQPAPMQPIQESVVYFPPRPPVVRPFTSFRCPVTGQWFLMYKQEDCPPFFTIDQDWN